MRDESAMGVPKATVGASAATAVGHFPGVSPTARRVTPALAVPYWSVPARISVDTANGLFDDVPTGPDEYTAAASANLVATALSLRLIDPTLVHGVIVAGGADEHAQLREAAVGELGAWMLRVAGQCCADAVPTDFCRFVLLPMEAFSHRRYPLLVAWEGDPLAISIPANDLDPRLARALYLAFGLIGRLGLGTLSDQMLAYSWWVDGLIDLVSELEADGALSDDEAVLRQARAHPVVAWQGTLNDEQVLDMIRSRAAWGSARAKAWEVPLPGEPEKHSQTSHDLADWLVQLVWSWRRASPALYHSDWAALVRGIAQDVRLRARLGGLEDSYVEESFALADAVVALFGAPWEPEAFDELCEVTANTREGFLTCWEIDGLDPDNTAASLRWLARAVGWFARAQEIGCNP